MNCVENQRVVSPFGDTTSIDKLSSAMSAMKDRGELEAYSFFFNGGPEMTAGQYANDINQMLEAYKNGHCEDVTDAVLAGRI